MIEMDIEELKESVRRNNEKYKDVIEKFEKKVREKGLKQGRVRQRDPNEQRILDSFTKK
jgi:hypothetical protein